jgi:hypothetical protein
MKCPFADKRFAQILKKLTYQEILSYHPSHAKRCLNKEGCFGSSNLEMVPYERFWANKAKDTA